jgi:hypothetical protein
MILRMTLFRRVALNLLLVAAAAVLILAVIQLWNYRQWGYLPSNGPIASSLDARSAILQDRMEILSRRVGDMELLVLVLLGTSGLYAIVFVVSSYFSAITFARQADRTVNHIKDEIGLAMGDLRELKEQTERKLEPLPLPEKALAAQISSLASRIAGWEGEKLELFQHERVAAALEAAASPALAPALAGLYQRFATAFAPFDRTRARFYLDRAFQLAPAGSELASRIRYGLACWFAAGHDFELAMRELTVAFEHQSKALEDRLAIDIDDGGQLYELASTPPFDKALNDLLLKIVA